MPLAVYLLGVAVFAQGTSEFMLAGLVPGIAADLEVSLSSAGLLTSAFAVGMVVGAPVMAVLALRWSRRRCLLGFLVAFLVVHVVGALTTSFELLLVTRVLGAVANAGFVAVALATATALVPPDAKGRATSVLIGGVTLACVAGVPAGALVGQLWGWRAAFWAVALVSAPALVAVARSVPASSPPGAGTGVRRELRVLREPRLLVVLALGALVNAGTFCTFTYLAPLVTEVAGVDAGWVPGVLALFGVGSFVGVSVAGRLADTRPLPLLVAGGVALAFGWVALALAAGDALALFALVLVQGTLAFAVGSTLISQSLYAAADAPTLTGGLSTAALNVGAALGPWVGGLTLDMGLGFRSPAFASGALVAAALLTAAGAEVLRRRGARRRSSLHLR